MSEINSSPILKYIFFRTFIVLVITTFCVVTFSGINNEFFVCVFTFTYPYFRESNRFWYGIRQNY